MEFSIPKEKIDIAINDSMIASIKHCIKGKKLTPFLLNEVLKITGGESLKANIALMKNNALLASEISQSFSRIMNK